LDYARLLAEVKERVLSAQYKALKAVNTELVGLYWDIGRMIVDRQIMPWFSHQADVAVYKRIAAFSLDSDTLFLLGIIVNEVITNAMKYAFVGRETGTIRIYCDKTKDPVSLIIQNDGVGRPRVMI